MNQNDPTPMYPGDAYVDLIGVDNYDTSWSTHYPPSDHVQSWNGILNGAGASTGWSTSHRQHGKPCAAGVGPLLPVRRARRR